MAALIPVSMAAGIASLANGVMSRKKKKSKKSPTKRGSSSVLLPVRRLAPASGLQSRRSRNKGSPGYNERPVNYGASIGPSRISFNVGRPLPSAEFAANEGIRIHGSGVLSPAVSPLFTTAGLNGLFNTNVSNVAYLQPNTVDPRLSTITRCFQQYAFRELRIRYTPSVGTTSTGSIALGLVRNADLFDSLKQTSPTIANNPQSTVLQFENSMLFQQGTPSEFVYRHHGTETWQCNTSTSVPSDRSELSQGILLVAYDHNEAASTSVSLGSLWAEWVIDIYGLSAVVGSPMLTTDCRESGEKTEEKKDPPSDSAGAIVKARTQLPETQQGIKIVEGFHQPPPPLKRSDSTESLLTTEIRRAVRAGALGIPNGSK